MTLAPGGFGLGQQLAGHAAVQHRRLVHHQHSPLAPARAGAVLDPEQGRVDRAGLGEPVRLQVLRYGVGRGQSRDTVAGRLVRFAHVGARTRAENSGDLTSASSKDHASYAPEQCSQCIRKAQEARQS